MKDSGFLSFDGDSLFSHIKIYRNEAKQKIHLIPISHIGKTEYFHELVEYVGKKTCMFEYLTTGSESVANRIKNLDDYLALYKPRCEEFWQKYKKFILSYYKNFISKDLNKFRKDVKKAAKKSNEKIRQIYEYSEKTKFSFPNLQMIQLCWCELIKLDHQFLVLDFKNDILNRPNWIHTDLNIEELNKDVDMEELMMQLLTNPNLAQISETQKEINVVLNSILELIEISQIPSYSLRRMNFASMIIDVMTKSYETYEKMNPELLMKTRNKLIETSILDLITDNNEFMVFYGASHMINIEKFILKEGFSFESQKKFEVFNINLT